jgi:hypothetical protein
LFSAFVSLRSPGVALPAPSREHIMEVQDGFIVGIFNHCDRWCERCAFTSHGRVFADRAEMEASLDANLKAVVEALPLPQDVPPPPPPGWKS